MGLLPIHRVQSEIDVVSTQLCLLDGVCNGAVPHVSGSQKKGERRKVRGIEGKKSERKLE